MSRADVRGGISAAYAASAEAWADAPNRIYQHLADVLVAAAPVPLRDLTMADLGAGTGTVSRALRAAGSRVVAVDLVREMLTQGAPPRPPSVVADLVDVPLAGRAVDGAAAAFVLNHLADPGAALREMDRISRAGGPVLASVFATQPHHPAKAVVDDVATSFGYVVPSWYGAMKADIEPLTALPERLAALAERAGLASVEVAQRPVDIGADTAETIAVYRLSMAHLAPFVAGLDPTRRAELTAAAVAALGPDVEPIRPEVVLLSARGSGRPPR